MMLTFENSGGGGGKHDAGGGESQGTPPLYEPCSILYCVLVLPSSSFSRHICKRIERSKMETSQLTNLYMHMAQDKPAFYGRLLQINMFNGSCEKPVNHKQ